MSLCNNSLFLVLSELSLFSPPEKQRTASVEQVSPLEKQRTASVGQVSPLEKQRTASVGQVSPLEKQRTASFGQVSPPEKQRTSVGKMSPRGYFRFVEYSVDGFIIFSYRQFNMSEKNDVT